MKNHDKKKEMELYGKRLVGPVMLPFTEWILSSAIKKGIRRIYFLSRDGYLLCHIAKEICKREGIPIECRYLYCSRQALRIPSYCLAEDEVFDLLTLWGYYVTPKSLLERAALDEEEAEAVRKELNISDLDSPLTQSELESLKKSLKHSVFYKKALARRSEEAYRLTVEYFSCEGLFEQKDLAIADSGWSGSMQRSLRQLLESAGYRGKIHGFYFGMYTSPKEESDGEYSTYYFDKAHGLLRKSSFNNNLFECMLSAPHPMTAGYEKSSDGRVTPIFTAELTKDQKEMTEAQIRGALEYVDDIKRRKTSPFIYKKAIRRTRKLLRRYMIYPDRKFAEIYGSFAFCDDMTEGYHLHLADASQRRMLKKYMLFPRVIRKIFGLKAGDSGELLWPYGTIAFCPKIIRPWYRFNIRAWEFFKALLK